jgi:hypothetical protein
MSTTEFMRHPRLVRDTLGWGVALWLIGYALGIVLFAIVPAPLIGWIIMPIGLVITIWVLLTRVKAQSVFLYPVLSLVWTLIAVIGDYVFIVRAFSPIDGYYKLDVYFYYALTFVLPLTVGWWKSSHQVPTPRPT